MEFVAELVDRPEPVASDRRPHPAGSRRADGRRSIPSPASGARSSCTRATARRSGRCLPVESSRSWTCSNATCSRARPCISDDDEEVFAYASEVMSELLAIHPFREGNGRTAFIVGNLDAHAERPAPARRRTNGATTRTATSPPAKQAGSTRTTRRSPSCSPSGKRRPPSAGRKRHG